MKAGKIASVALWFIVTALTVGIGLAAASMDVFASPMRIGSILLLCGAVAGVYALILLPVGLALDLSIRRLQRYMEDTTAQLGASSYLGPKWLRPITRAFTGVVDSFHQREQDLRTQIRDLEIRNRVSEAHRRQIETVLNSLRDGVLVTDAFGEIVTVNAAAAQLLGFDAAEAVHKPLEDMVDDARLCQIISDTRQSGDFASMRRVEHELDRDESMRIDGESATATYEIALTCVENHKGDVGGVVTILHDISREREISHLKSDFVSKASHELRTPLSSIRAYVEMLVDGEAQDEDSRNEFYRIILNETDRLGRLIDNMLNISRIEAGIVQIDRVNVDLKGIVRRAMDTIEPQARERNITLHSKLADINLCVEGDDDMIHQVVLNLMSNAVKYTPEGGRVTVSADTDNLTQSVLVSVSDTGLGIPPDALPRLFEKFYRIENYKRVAKGTGLGLSLCKHIVETLHHGQIGVESRLGMGSRFWFSIPMRYAGSQAAA